MAGEKARELPYQATHRIVKKLTFSDLGTTVNLGDVPACIVTEVKSVKTVDFNSGTTATVSVGIDYSDATASSTSALVATANLLAAVAQGPTTLSFVDNALSVITVPATLTATLAATGTAATAGETYIVVDYQPLSHLG